MPGGDRRGPGGMGPMTGRELGFCAGSDQPGFMADDQARGGSGYGGGLRYRNRGGTGFGRGFGFGGGRGRGHAHGWGRQSLPESADDRRRAAGPVEIELDLAGELAALKERINALAEQVASSTTGNH